MYFYTFKTLNQEIFVRIFYFCDTSQMRSFVKIKPSRNSKITLSFTDVGTSYASHESVT